MKTEKDAIKALESQADELLAVCWAKLKAQEVTREDIEKMVEGWNLRYEAFLIKEEAKEK